MNSNRRADLQRKLSMNAVPRPPAGLADRIKADIPKYLQPETERGRFSRSVAFHMRIAASILLVVTTLLVTVYLVDAPPAEKAASVAPGPFAPAPRALPQPATASTAPESVRFEVAEEDAALEVPQIAMATPPPQQVAPQRRERTDFPSAPPVVESGVESTAAAGVAGGIVGGTVGGVARNAEPQAVVAQDLAAPEPMPATAAAAPAAAPVMPPVVAEAAPTRALTADVREKTRKAEAFGISLDPQNFHRIRAILESGARPAASAVDVEAIVNYFAGPPARRPRRGVALDVELSPAAVEAEGDHAILRFSIDTPAAGTQVASNVRVDVVVNDKVVESHKRVGGTEPLPSESLLPNGTSVTGLYALVLRPEPKARKLVATVHLHYTLNGRNQTITRHVHTDALSRGWQRASRRHRLASLGAVWGETLKGTAPGFDVARRAEELAAQEPKDAKAKELAAAVNASVGDGSP